MNAVDIGRFEIVTFDCYGTLIDWERGIGDAFVAAAAADGVRLDRDNVLAAYAEIEPVVEAEPHRPYRDVLRETACRVASRLAWPLAAARADFLPQSLPEWPPFADTIAALARLSEGGFRLGILSNVDDDLLAATVKRLGVRFELLVTAEQVRSYKPAAGHFLEARRRIGAARWLHAAASRFHDVEPTLRLSVPVVWVNRRRESPSADARVPEFASLEVFARAALS